MGIRISRTERLLSLLVTVCLLSGLGPSHAMFHGHGHHGHASADDHSSVCTAHHPVPVDESDHDGPSLLEHEGIGHACTLCGLSGALAIVSTRIHRHLGCDRYRVPIPTEWLDEASQYRAPARAPPGRV